MIDELPVSDQLVALRREVAALWEAVHEIRLRSVAAQATGHPQVEVIPGRQPDRPDIDALRREYEADVAARDSVITELRAAVADLDRRQRRADPIVQQAVQQGPRSITADMLVEINRRMEQMAKRVNQLDAAVETKRVLALPEAERNEGC